MDDYLYRERGIHITMLRHPKGFEYLMFEEEKPVSYTHLDVYKRQSYVSDVFILGFYIPGCAVFLKTRNKFFR